MNEKWDRIVATIPSKHMPPGCELVGFRRELASMAETAKSVRYLEIGCRLGHSLAAVALAAGSRLQRAVAVDLWIENYGEEPNAGPIAVSDRLERLGVDSTKVEFFSGDSHAIVQQLAGTFNLILVDGDHTVDGAMADLRDCYRLLEPGGVIVFDDAVEELLTVWRRWLPDSAHGWESLTSRPPYCAARRKWC